MKNFDIRSVSKAIAGAVATVIVAYLARKNIIIEGRDVETVIEFLVAAAIGFLTVYLSPKNRG